MGPSNTKQCCIPRTSEVLVPLYLLVLRSEYKTQGAPDSLPYCVLYSKRREGFFEREGVPEHVVQPG